MKILPIFLLLLSSVSTYGQDTTYLNCTHTPESEQIRIGRILILDSTRRIWDDIYLLAEEDLESTLNESWIERNQATMNLDLKSTITRVGSDAYYLKYSYSNLTRFKLDRLTGELVDYRDNSDNPEIVAHCLPVTRSDVQAILQDEINRRDAIIAENEEKRLF